MHKDKQENMRNWQIQDMDVVNKTDEGIIEKDEKGYHHIGSKYSVLLKDYDLVGKKVRIINSKQNTHSITKKYYPLFVREEDFQLVN